jgi:hypothetical protein
VKKRDDDLTMQSLYFLVWQAFINKCDEAQHMFFEDLMFYICKVDKPLSTCKKHSALEVNFMTMSSCLVSLEEMLFNHNKKDNGFACLAKSYICNNCFYKFCFVDVSRWCEYVYFGY